MSVKTHWQVVNRTYPMPRPHTITEFEFGNGVSIHYNPEPGEMTIFLPTKESYLSLLMKWCKKTRWRSN